MHLINERKTRAEPTIKECIVHKVTNKSALLLALDSPLILANLRGFSTSLSSISHKGGRLPTYIGQRANLYRDCYRESCPLFILLRHRTPSSSIHLSEEKHKPCALSRVFLSFSGRKSIVLVKKKAPSRSGFSASMYVVLKTRHANPNIHVRRY